jgi:hypothetical protein
MLRPHPLPTLFLAGLFLAGLAVNSYAQGFNYIDESGNIFFVDRLDQVPPRYQNQFVTPTPIPVDRHGRPIVPKKSKEQLAKEKEKRKKEAQKEREKAKQRRAAEEKQRQLNKIRRMVPRVERQG